MTIDMKGAQKAHTRGLEINTYSVDADTCWVWRKDGPLEKAHRKQLGEFLGGG